MGFALVWLATAELAPMPFRCVERVGCDGVVKRGYNIVVNGLLTLRFTNCGPVGPSHRKAGFARKAECDASDCRHWRPLG